MNFIGNDLATAELDRRLMMLECLKENAANLKVERRIMYRRYLEAFEEHKADVARSDELYAEGRVDEYQTLLDKVSEGLAEFRVHYRQIGELDTQFCATIRTVIRICDGLPRLPRIDSIVDELGELMASFPHLEDRRDQGEM